MPVLFLCITIFVVFMHEVLLNHLQGTAKEVQLRVLLREQCLIVLQLVYYEECTFSLLHLLQSTLNFIYLFYALPQPFLFPMEVFIQKQFTFQTIYFFKITSDKAGYRFGKVFLPGSWESCCSDALP